ncbi:uncharacterized protein MYCGRDRAFT_93730 [Zymoseptoria tritici IPO323]|uniref:Uncharacterized protein n=1 Tax=Zymoseptoria tritici (strain CBS 115943 / IPO323) TaxID=336722 RepID=F9XCU0_ZYMTI|nr:uncharacterized protein MYCGRDRAFT_93730 [Zymoseptoria tritici IPO323]EGP86910.1 hypothetical protein MYCGRDRAFT_93730 [Zymoseptoria tritici IPO323]
MSDFQELSAKFRVAAATKKRDFKATKASYVSVAAKPAKKRTVIPQAHTRTSKGAKQVDNLPDPPKFDKNDPFGSLGQPGTSSSSSSFSFNGAGGSNYGLDGAGLGPSYIDNSGTLSKALARRLNNASLQQRNRSLQQRNPSSALFRNPSST